MEIKLSDLVGPECAAKAIGVSRMSLWRWIRGKKITVIKVGNRAFVPRSEVERIRQERNKQ